MTNREAIDVLFNEWKCIDRNDGIHCDRKCESCDLVMDVWIIREAFNMAISALQEQELKQEVKNLKESSLTQKGLDTISRQAAIELAMQYCPDDDGSCSKADRDIRELLDDLENLPSAQPTLYGYNMEHLKLIAEVLRKENLSPERVAEALTDVGRIVSIVRAEFEEELRKAVERCMI